MGHCISRPPSEFYDRDWHGWKAIAWKYNGNTEWSRDMDALFTKRWWRHAFPPSEATEKDAKDAFVQWALSNGAETGLTSDDVAVDYIVEELSWFWFSHRPGRPVLVVSCNLTTCWFPRA